MEVEREMGKRGDGIGQGHTRPQRAASVYVEFLLADLAGPLSLASRQGG